MFRTSPVQVEAQEAHVEAHDRAHEPMTAVDMSILTACAAVPRSASEQVEMLGYCSRTGNFKKAVAGLIWQGLLAMTIPEIPWARAQRYRLTRVGIPILEKTK
jgi:ATP-dependent DNA helicase RecG